MNHLMLLDTNIISFIFKQDSRALPYEPYLQGRPLALSMMTVAELFQWVAIRQWGEFRVTQLETMLAEQYTLLPIDLETCRWWGKVLAKCRQLGRPISPQDAWIAATALQYQLPLVTHNPSDFEVIEGILLYHSSLISRCKGCQCLLVAHSLNRPDRSSRSVRSNLPSPPYKLLNHFSFR